jgi:hypothetical protein
MMRDCSSNCGNVTISAAASTSLPQVTMPGDCSYSTAPERRVSMPHATLEYAGARQIMTRARFAWRSRSTPAASKAVDATAAAAAGAARSMATSACSAAVCVRSRRGRGIGGACGLVTAVESTARRRCRCALQSMNAAAAVAAAAAAASALSELPNPPATDGGSQQLRMTGRTAA